MLAGCGGGNSGDDNPGTVALETGTTATNDDVLTAITTAPVGTRQAMFDYIEDEYLWYADLPSVDLNDEKYADLRTLLEDLRKRPEDRFSGLANAVSQVQRFQELSLIHI